MDESRKNKLMRFEFWFMDGTFRAFPNVIGESIREDEENGIIQFAFFGNSTKDRIHSANINWENVLFLESWITGEEKKEKTE